MKNILKVLALALAAVALATGCTSREMNDSKLKIVNFPLGDDVKSLDPALVYDTVSNTVMPLAVEPLYQYSFLKSPLEVEPLLADGMPKISPDKKTYTIKIKKGVMFQDDAAFPGGKGRELVAEDFVYGWKRLLVPALKSPGTWVYEDKVVGYSELKKAMWNDKSKGIEDHLATPIEGLKALDSHTLQVKLTQPYPQLIHIMTMGFAAPVAKEVTTKYGQEGLAERMVGTGPFLLKKVTRGSKIELVKNPTFRGESFPTDGDADAKAAGLLADAGKAIPFIDGIIFHVFKEDQPQWLQFQKGSIDASGIPKDNFSSAIQTGVDADCSNALKNAKLGPELDKKGIQLFTSPEPVIWYLNFNVKDKLLGQNANLRKAMVRALNRDEMIKLFLNCRGQKATSIVPPVISGHVAREQLEGDFNVEEAKKYLVKAGFPGGKGLSPIKFDLRGASTTARQQAEYVAKSMAAIGVPIEVVVNTFPAYLEKEKNGNLQFFFGGWNADYPDAENFMQLLYGKNVSPGPNASNWVNKEYDALYEKIAQMSPSKERSAMIKRAEDIAFNDAVWSMLYYPIRFSLRHGWVKNYRPNSMISNDLKYIDIDKEMKQKYLKERF